MTFSNLDGNQETKQARTAAALQIGKEAMALQKIAEEHNIEFLAYILRLVVLETQGVLLEDEAFLENEISHPSTPA